MCLHIIIYHKKHLARDHIFEFAVYVKQYFYN